MSSNHFLKSAFPGSANAAGAQTIRVVRFTAGPPPAFAGTTNSFVQLFTVTNAPATGVVPCNIPVATGDIIGVYGARGANCVNSYGPANFVTSINGFNTTLQRSGMQSCPAGTGAAMANIWSEVNYNIGRITMYINCCQTPTITASSNTQNSSITGSVGVVYRPSDTWKISANASTGFRAPNVDDIGKLFDFTDGDVVVPNTNLKAEYAYNGEVSISKIIGNILKIDATGFYTYLDHAMVRREFQVNGQDSIMYDGQMSKVYAIQNAAYGTVYGFNAGFEIRFPSGFSLSTRYNYQYGVEEMDNGNLSRSRHAAPAFGVTRLSYQKNKLFMQLYAMYSAKVSHSDLNDEEQQKPFIYATDGDGNPYSPSWYTLNLKSMYKLTENFTVTAGLENITDQRYRPYSSGIVAPGKNFVLALRAKF